MFDIILLQRKHGPWNIIYILPLDYLVAYFP